MGVQISKFVSPLQRPEEAAFVCRSPATNRREIETGFSHSEVDVSVVVSVIAAGFLTDPEAVMGPTRARARIAFTRQVSMYVAHVGLGLSLTEVGRKFGRDRTTAAHACRLVEDLRDNKSFDFALEHLEAAMLKLAALAVRT